MTDVAEAVYNKTWSTCPQQDWWYGMAEGAVELAPFSDLVPADLIRLVEEKKGPSPEASWRISGHERLDLLKMHYLESNVVGELPES